MDAYRFPPHKPVFDWNNEPVGRILDARVDPRTRSVSSFVVALSGEAQRRMASPLSEMVIPVGMVHSLRPGEVVLDRPLEALRALERAAARSA